MDARRIVALAYPTVGRTDRVTERLKPLFAHWRPVRGLSDAEAVQVIATDEVDVLVDLSGHTADNRLGIFVLRAASVQVSWLGFFASTGLQAMDYLLTDANSAPAGSERMFAEKLWRLPETRLCFTPPDTSDRFPVGPLPAVRNGAITFGCFQRWSKINADVLGLWARLLDGLPTARLQLQSMHSGRQEQVQAMLARCAAAGIDTARITINPPMPRDTYLRAYANVDIALDTFPYTGGTTTCEALWMGVPTLTLAGETMISRQGLAIMITVGLPDWIAATTDDFVRRALDLAADIPALATLRAALRAQVEASALFDSARFAGHLESALLSMWKEVRDAQAQATMTRVAEMNDK